MHGIDNDIDSRPQLTVQEGQQPGPQSAGRTRSRHLQDTLPQVTLDDGRQSGQAGIELRDHLRGGPFLGPVHLCRAARTGQGIIHIASHLHAHVLETLIEPRHVDRGHARQAASVVGHLTSTRIEKADPQRARHAHAAVGRGAATNADQKVGDAQFQSVLDQFTRATGGGAHRVTL